GRCLRRGPAQFALDFRELQIVKTDDADADIVRLTKQIQAQLESWIRERPDEWMWGHRRWSRDVLRPDR
ncbi:MAG: lauroyl acyltransferase, partial [Pseudomonadota bacterium]